MEAAAPGADKTASVLSCGVSWKPAEPRGTHHPGHEHSAALHEGAWEPDPR